MKRNRLKSLIVLVCLIAMTGMAMAVHENIAKPDYGNGAAGPPGVTAANGIVTVSASLVQDKVLKGSDGTVNLVLTLKADDAGDGAHPAENAVDMVLVLDCSGSMQGSKIDDAKRAVSSLLDDLTEEDRFGLISYSDGAWEHSGLIRVTDTNRWKLNHMVNRILARGNTNLGAGLGSGMRLLSQRRLHDRAGKLILISDGLANRGVTHPRELGEMAALAVSEEFSVSTVGVGVEFNEQLMTVIADQGAGSYYYLHRPDLFADVFTEEFRHARATAASGLEVRIGQADGIRLVDASGYPIRTGKDTVLFNPGSLSWGQSRKLYLKLQVPTDRLKTYRLDGFSVTYRYDGKAHQAGLTSPLEIACVEDPKVVLNSIDKDGWARQVLESDYNRLKEDVSADIRSGKKAAALQRIDAYWREQGKVNAHVKSPEVTDNLGREIKGLRDVVEETFAGEASEVLEKQKTRSKALQYEGYRGKRGLQ